MPPHWRHWMQLANRRLEPATSFCEPTDAADPVIGQKVWIWFALDERQPLFVFTGLWCYWTGARSTNKNPIEGDHRLFGFQTTDPNETLHPIQSKAMPVSFGHDVG